MLTTYLALALAAATLLAAGATVHYTRQAVRLRRQAAALYQGRR